jgi:2-polyprenyl-3-methyl-5-hydroxy-6-metoxy-1,4-benzoquinol methylase
MGSYIYKQIDFEHPSFLFILEDKLKALLGGPFFYNSYLKTFGLNGSERVLDFGCGGGTGSVCLARFLNTSGELTCVDVSKYWIDKARKRLKRYSNAKCLVGDIRELDISENRFDVISIIHVIHDIAPAERQSVTDRLASLLDRHGKLFIREPIRESHGMPVSEIVTRLTNSGLTEVQANLGKSEYRGIFGYQN